MTRVRNEVRMRMLRVPNGLRAQKKPPKEWLENVVEPRGIEPLTSWLPAMRSPS